MSLVLDSLDFLQNPDDSYGILQNTINNCVSPVNENLDDEVPEVSSGKNHPHKFYNSFVKLVRQKMPSEKTKHLSGSEEENQEHSIIDISPEKTDERPTSSQGSAISVYSESETNQQENTNQVTFRNKHVLHPLQKRTHFGENKKPIQAKIRPLTNFIPLKDNNRLLPEFVKKLTTEKDRLINNILTRVKPNIEDNFTKTVDVITKAIEYHETSIKEEQTKLVSVLENLNLHHTILQQNQSELEKMHCQILEQLETCDEEAEEKIDEIYREAEEAIYSYADVVKRDQWHNFSESVINSINSRLSGYLDI